MSGYDTLALMAHKLSQRPKDQTSSEWGRYELSSSYIHREVDAAVSRHRKLFRRKKLPFCRGHLYIYRHPSTRVFDLIKNEPILQECRGLITSLLGVMCRPLPVMETKRWEDATAALDDGATATVKIDGRMVMFIQTPDGLRSVDKAGRVVRLPRRCVRQVQQLVHDAEVLGLTPVFEFTDKQRPVVIRTPTALSLVGIRSILTGRIMEVSDLLTVANQYGVDTVTPVTSTADLTKLGLIEGLVFASSDTVWRAKTPEFRELRGAVNSIRYRHDGLQRPISLCLLSDKDIEAHLSKREITILKRRKREDE